MTTNTNRPALKNIESAFLAAFQSSPAKMKKIKVCGLVFLAAKVNEATIAIFIIHATNGKKIGSYNIAA